MYEIKINFHDDNLPSEKQFENLNDLALYLERVPSMIGFVLTESATIDIRVKHKPSVATLF